MAGERSERRYMTQEKHGMTHYSMLVLIMTNQAIESAMQSFLSARSMLETHPCEQGCVVAVKATWRTFCNVVGGERRARSMFDEDGLPLVGNAGQAR